MESRIFRVHQQLLVKIVVPEAQAHFHKVHESMGNYWPFYYHDKALSLIIGQCEENLQLHDSIEEARFSGSFPAGPHYLQRSHDL